MAEIAASMGQGAVKAGSFPVSMILSIKDYIFKEYTDEQSQTRTRRIFKLLWFFFYTSLFITVFAVGGILTVFIGMVYAYLAIYKKFKCFNSNIPDSSCQL